MGVSLTKDQFIAKARTVHGDRYEYSGVVYVKSQQKVSITCTTHGDFDQTPNAHLNGQGCPTCYKEAKLIQVTTADFIRRSMAVHGSLYDYSKSVYTKSLDKIEIICPVHGSFWQQAGQHMLGQTCAQCYRDSMRKTPEQFIAEVKSVHGDVYDYPNAYTGFFDPIEITCREHGAFVQRSDIHLRGSGCSKCVSTMTSSASQEWIASLGLVHAVQEFRIPGTRFHADLYCPDTNTVYEFYGDFWHGHPTRYDPTSVNVVKHKTFGELYEETMAREKVIKDLGYNLITIWESDWNQLKG